MKLFGPKKDALSEKDAKIVNVINKMRSAGSSDSEIIQTLKESGVEEARAKKLIGQAGASGIAKTEAATIAGKKGIPTEESLAGEKVEIREFIKEEAEAEMLELKEKLAGEVKENLVEYKLKLAGKEAEFKKAINENVSSMADLSERVRTKLNDLSSQLKTVQLDLQEAKLAGAHSRNRIISIVLLVLGIIFLVTDLALFYNGFAGAFTLTVDAVILLVIMAFAGITMMFTATLV